MENINENSHLLLREILTLAQLCGLFPVDNIRNPTADQIKFRWVSWKVFYSIVLWLSTLFCGLVALTKAFNYKSALSLLIPPLFYLCTSFATIIFIWIAKRWATFIQSLCKVEEELLLKYKATCNLRKKLRITAVVLYAPALCEHTLGTMKYIYSHTCQNNSSGWERYFKKQFHYIFYFFPYHHMAGILLLIISWLGWVIWNFGDVFIISLSIILSNRFMMISNTLELYLSTETSSSSKNKHNFPTIHHRTFFTQIREDYNKLAVISKNLNQLLSDLIITCYVFNLSFILVQLFNSIRQMETHIERAYFFYSFGFVIARTIIVSIYAASVNEASRSFLPILNSVPTTFYCVEIQRLIMQIHADSSALTGHNFFRITRGMVLNIAAAIITYELVLIQFNQDTLEKYKSHNGTICF